LIWHGICAASIDGLLTVKLSSAYFSELVMPRKSSEPIKRGDIVGLKYFDMLLPLMKPLHDDHCERDKANNRELHYDQYCLLILLYLFNPTVSSLPAIEQASELENVQKKRCQEPFIDIWG